VLSNPADSIGTAEGPRHSARPRPCAAGPGTAHWRAWFDRERRLLRTEHRDTLNYLQARIGTLLGRAQAVVVIHGGMGREDRMKAQESFRYDPEVQVLLAIDAVGEGINLQRAHLMVNYDLPWTPNRLEPGLRDGLNWGPLRAECGTECGTEEALFRQFIEISIEN
jgi:hypothetical protein